MPPVAGKEKLKWMENLDHWISIVNSDDVENDACFTSRRVASNSFIRLQPMNEVERYADKNWDVE